MGLIRAAGDFFRNNNLGQVRSSALVSPATSLNATRLNSLGNVALYSAAAYTGPIGGGVTMLAGVCKGLSGLVVMSSSHYYEGAQKAAYIALGKDLLKGGAENLLVGAAACHPVGQCAAWVMAGRAVAEHVSARPVPAFSV